MQTIKAIDRSGNLWKRVNKAIARKTFELNKDVCIVPVGCRPFLCNDRRIVNRAHDARIPFDSHVYDYALQVCRQERNEYPAYFVRE